MPTEVEFMQAAAQFDSAGGDLSSLAHVLRGLDVSGVVVGGRLGDATPGIVERSARELAEAMALVHAGAELCRHRAEIVRAYRMALAAYQQDMVQWQSAMVGWRGSKAAAASDPTVSYGPQPVMPTAPPPPPAWVELG